MLSLCRIEQFALSKATVNTWEASIHNTQVRPVVGICCETRMSNDEPQQTEWGDEVGLSEETTYVALYPSRTHAEQWMKEAEEQGYPTQYY